MYQRIRDFRALMLLFCIALLLMLVACTPTPIAPDVADVRTVSVVRLCEQTGLSVQRADELLELLETLGYSGEVLFAYLATDADDMEYYHVWIGERTVDVYFDGEGRVASLRQSGVVLYGDTQVPSDQTNEPPAADEPKDEPEEQQAPSEQTPAEAEPSEDETDEYERSPAELTLSLKEMSEQVAAGNDAYVRALGRAGEEYRIEVHLKSGISTAKGLEAQVADADGTLLWDWKVSGRTTPGDYLIRIVRASDERDALELAFSILPKAEQ